MKTILKIFLVIVLMGVLAGISYIKSGRSAKREAGQAEAIHFEWARVQDSIQMAQLADSSRHYIDSLMALDAFYQTQIDSLNQYYANIEADLKSELKKAQEVKTTAQKTTTNKKKTTSDKNSKNQTIKSEFKKMIGELPSDLTDYEKRVAYNEVKLELAQKYNMSPESLDKIVR
ncbi:MAG: hypothetical protein ABIJ45_01425 [Candidatus Zixiibacteriota bacterium]